MPAEQSVRVGRFTPTGITHPIVQAPMAGGPSTPALAASVSTAGGLGFLAAGYKSVEAVQRELEEIRSLLADRHHTVSISSRHPVMVPASQG